MRNGREEKARKLVGWPRSAKRVRTGASERSLRDLRCSSFCLEDTQVTLEDQQSLCDKLRLARNEETGQDGQYALEARHHGLRWDQVRFLRV